MVNIHMENNYAEIAFQGKPLDVAAELAAAISGIYQGLYANNLEDAEVFRAVMERATKGGSPVWNREHDMTMVTMAAKK